jgi:cytochrome c peroxidase
MKLLKVFEFIFSAAVTLIVLNLFLERPTQMAYDWLHWQMPFWNESELLDLQSLWIENLPPLPPDITNQYSTDKLAADLGHKIFFDPRFSIYGRVSCSTCHEPERIFTDGRKLAFGANIHTLNTPTILGSAYSPWLFHDGRADSQWAQVLQTMENDVEHGGSRGQYAHVLADFYREEYEAIFGPLPDLSDLERFPLRAGPVIEETAVEGWASMSIDDQKTVTQIYVNLAKALAAYQRQMVPGESRFDQYVRALIDGSRKSRLASLTQDEVAGARLFIGKGECILCHSGPLLTNHSFHNIGTPDIRPDQGRISGVAKLLQSEFNCRGPYSDVDRVEDCVELRFVRLMGHEIEGAVRTPTLRSLQKTAPYFHAGQFATLAEVLEFYNDAPQPSEGHSELRPLRLTPRELYQLEVFLVSLDSPINVTGDLLLPP